MREKDDVVSMLALAWQLATSFNVVPAGVSVISRYETSFENLALLTSQSGRGAHVQVDGPTCDVRRERSFSVLPVGVWR